MSTQLATQQQRQPTAFDTLRDLLERSKTKLAEVLPKHLTADRLVRIAVAACSRTPQLLECPPVTVLSSVMQAAQLGLEPGGPLGGAYLVPYKNRKTGKRECQLIVGYRGLIDLSRRSGQIASIEARVVRSSDKFRCVYGLSPALEHEPNWTGEPGDMVAVYAVAVLRDGTRQVEVMTRAQVEAIRARSKASDGGPWVTDFEEMARKTVVRRIAKYLPLSTELATALELEDRAEGGEPTTDLVDLPQAELPQRLPSKTEQVKAKLGAPPPGATSGPQGAPAAPPDGPPEPTPPEGDDDHIEF